MDAYIYKAALYCEDCAGKIERSLPAMPIRDVLTDSGQYPQGPYPNGGGEADTPQHCDTCGLFLENPLTGDGIAYVRSELARANVGDGPLPGGAITLAEWRTFYVDALA